MSKSHNRNYSVPLHPNNPHQGRYDFNQLIATLPKLKAHLIDNPVGDKTIDFNDAEAVKTLNQALLAHYYAVRFWQIPPNYLCPPIPGRADHIHHLAQLLSDNGIDPTTKIKALDIGTGASCIYPIIGSQAYNWRFVASDINPISIKVSQTIVDSNKNLKGRIKLRLQPNQSDIFTGIIKPDEHFHITMCNPPFHDSPQAALASNQRKVKNLSKNRGESNITSNLNFGGQNAELWCEGGELAFIQIMINQSVRYAEQVEWFSSLVSKKANLPTLKATLKQLKAKQVNVIQMSQGQKISHILAWRF